MTLSSNSLKKEQRETIRLSDILVEMRNRSTKKNAVLNLNGMLAYEERSKKGLIRQA